MDRRYEVPAVPVKQCPACNKQYDFDLNLLVCPDDRTMLLVPQPTYEIPGSDSLETLVYRLLWDLYYESDMVCPKCGWTDDMRLYCKNDKTLMERRLVDNGVDDILLLHNRYRIEEYLGERQFSHCFSGIDKELNKECMIQILSSNILLDEKSLQRFNRLVARAGELDHPAIYKIDSINSYRSNRYLKTPYIVGEPLDLKAAKRLGEHKNTNGGTALETIIEIFIDLLAALDYAHSKEIAHGNLSLSKMLILEDGSLKVMDFCMSSRQFKDLEWDGPQRETGTVNVYGDLEATTPEIMKGKHPSKASDIYAVGCALYEALAGKPPFERESDIQTVFAHLHDEPESFDERLEIPESLTEVVIKALAKEPEQRFESAAAMANALKNLHD